LLQGFELVEKRQPEHRADHRPAIAGQVAAHPEIVAFDFLSGIEPGEHGSWIGRGVQEIDVVEADRGFEAVALGMGGIKAISSSSLGSAGSGAMSMRIRSIRRCRTPLSDNAMPRFNAS
jgi:hypothetical protein